MMADVTLRKGYIELLPGCAWLLFASLRGRLKSYFRICVRERGAAVCHVEPLYAPMTLESSNIASEVGAMGADSTANAAANDSGSGVGSDPAARHYIQLMTAAINAVVITDASGVITAFNPAAETVFGCESIQALGGALDGFLPQEFLMPILKRSDAFDNPSSALEALPIRHQSVAARTSAGDSVHLTCSAYHTRVAGEVFTTFVFDPESEAAIMHNSSTPHHQFKALTNVAPVGIVQLASDWTADYANAMWCELSGLSMDETLGEGWVDAIHAEDVVDALVELREALSENQIYNKNIRLQRPTGQISWVRLSGTITISETGTFTGCLLVLLDITDSHLASEKLRYSANHDALTGLANRSSFIDKLQKRLDNPETRTNTSLLYLDLDGFKSINDTLGHDYGDELLRAVAERMLSFVAQSDVCARLGGDEFIIMVTSQRTVEQICELAECIVRGFKKAFMVFDNEVHLSTSVGISWGSQANETSEKLIKQADTALYKAKSSGRSRWMVYSREIQNEDIQHSLLKARVHRATERKEFTLFYQPQYRLADGKMIGFEALLRWYPTDIEVPQTQTVVEALEDCGLMNDVGQWVLETACQQFRRWQVSDLLPDGCSMSVNVSPAQLGLSNFASRLNAMLQRCKMDPRYLTLEITESALIEKNSNCIRVIEEVKAMGVRLSLDDFGTGYSSLSYLTRLPIDYIKIDKSFVMAMQTDESSRTIVSSVLAMAGTLKIDVVAEGIENQGTLEALRDGPSLCQFAQGYLYCKPKSAEDIEPLLIRDSYQRHNFIELT